MTQGSIHTLIFDLDGTISDPSEGIWKSVNYALTAYGHDPVGEDEFPQYIGPPIDQTFRALTGEKQEAHVLELVAKFRERYSDVGYSENRLYPEMPGVLKTLYQTGFRLGLCTGKRSDFAERILALFELRELFEFVDGGDVGITKSYQIERIGTAGTNLSKSTMIGDRASDVDAGHAHSLRTIGVAWGFGSLDELTTAGPTHLVHEPDALLKVTVGD